MWAACKHAPRCLLWKRARLHREATQHSHEALSMHAAHHRVHLACAVRQQVSGMAGCAPDCRARVSSPAPDCQRWAPRAARVARQGAADHGAGARFPAAARRQLLHHARAARVLRGRQRGGAAAGAPLAPCRQALDMRADANAISIIARHGRACPEQPLSSHIIPGSGRQCFV